MEAFADFRQGLEAASNEALGEIRRQWTEYNSEQGAIQAFRGFLAAVDWSVRRLSMLLSVHVGHTIVVVLMKRC